MIRTPGNDRGNLVIDSIKFSPLYQAGFCFTGSKGNWKIAGTTPIRDEKFPSVIHTLYRTELENSGAIYCRFKDLYKVLKSTGLLAQVSLDNVDWLVMSVEGTIFTDIPEGIIYKDQYGYNVTKVIALAVTALVTHLTGIDITQDKSSKVKRVTDCQSCKARRPRRRSDIELGDSGSDMYSTGTWDKSGPFKNDQVCGWTDDYITEWDMVCAKKNDAFKNNQSIPKTKLNDAGCHKGFTDIPTLDSFEIRHDEVNDILYVPAIGWDVELVGVNCKM